MITEPTESGGVYSYTAAAPVYYITWISADSWTLGSFDNATIDSPYKLFIQDTFTSTGRIDLITYVEAYTP